MLLSVTGKWLLFTGACLIALGALFWVVGKTGLPLGSLFGDIRIERGNFSFYFPIVTCIVLSILLTVLINIIARFFR